MAVITIANNGATFNIVRDGISRLVVKAQVHEISVVQTYFVKIDLGLGVLQNVYVDQRDVTSPSTVSAQALRDQLNSWMAGGSVTVSGGATEAKQDTQITSLSNMQTQLNDVKTKQDSQQTELQGLNTKLTSVQTKLDTVNTNLQTDRYLEFPLMVDESQPGIIYKGFAPPGSAAGASVWALQKITVVDGVTQLQWANGGMSFTFRWDDRDTVPYS